MVSRKTAVITGANGGIGKEIAIGLAKKRYHVVMLARNSQKSREAYGEVLSYTDKKSTDLVYVNLASLKSIHSAVAEIKEKCLKIDILINNAAVFKRNAEISSDGFEMTMAVNYLAVFHLTNSLLPLLDKSSSGKIINITSELYKKGGIQFDEFLVPKKYNGNQSYANSKLWLTLYSFLLAERLEGKSVTVNCIHPGIVNTGVFRDYPLWFTKLLGLFLQSPQSGAEPVLRLATSSMGERRSGLYFYKNKQMPLPEIAKDKQMANDIWKYTYARIGRLSTK